MSSLAVLQKAIPDVPGLLSWFTKGGVRQPPLTEVFPHSPVGRLALPAQAPDAEVSVHASGARVATQALPASPVVALSVTVPAGSVAEAASGAPAGSAHLLQNLAFGETAHRSHLRLVRELEALGASAQALASREHLTYEVEAPRGRAAEAAEILLDAVAHPSINLSAVHRAGKRCAADRARLAGPDAYLDAKLPARAYAGGPLGCALYGKSPPATASGVDAVRHFHAATHAASGVVLGAAGVDDHAAFLRLVSPLLDALPGGGAGEGNSTVSVPNSKYVGGFALDEAADDLVVALAFEGVGGSSDLKRDVARHVLAKLMGGGGSFSTGGPGKGMHSRLYQRVLCRDQRVADCSFFHDAYAATSLAGVRVAAGPGQGLTPADLLDVASRELEAVAASADEEGAARARNSMEANLGMILEAPAHVADDLSKTVSLYGRRVEAREFVDLIRATTAEDLRAEAAALLKTRPTAVVVGGGNCPSYEALVKRFS